MARLVTRFVLLSSVALFQQLPAGAQLQKIPDSAPALASDATAGSADSLEAVLPPLPAMPAGRTTVIGGVIHSVDPVQDQMTLDVFGGRPMKILFDERTQVYVDGKRKPLKDLRPSDHASVETALDGTNIFAESVHMLSQPPQGQTQGQILNYDPSTGQLTLRDALSQAPIRLSVDQSTSITRLGQPAFASKNEGTADLRPGSLIKAEFQSNNAGGAVARQITILATPGSAFVFTGTIAYLDLHSNLLVVHDPSNDRSYQISFDPALFPVSRNLHEGSKVMIQAGFDSSGYVARTITLQ